jgi:hypothetical protein
MLKSLIRPFRNEWLRRNGRRSGKRGSGRKNQTKAICLPSFEGET